MQRRLVCSLGDLRTKYLSRHLPGAQTGQMRGVLLAIDEPHALRSAKRHQRRERNFGGIGLARKHRFAEDGVTDRRAIQTAHQPAINPSFDAVRQARMMQCDIGRLHLGQDPSARLALAWRAGAGLDHGSKIVVNAHFAAWRG